MIKVLKFGGTSVGSAANMRRVADIIVREGASVTVLSAMSGTTDTLQRIASFAAAGGCEEEIALLLAGLKRKYVRCAGELLSDGYADASAAVERTMERVAAEAAAYAGEVSQRTIIAQGELLTTALFTLYMKERGCRAELLHAPAFIYGGEVRVDGGVLRQSVADAARGVYYITQGFICTGPDGRLDNLGRGGSDYSAALIGAALGAGEVQIWTDIDGMHNNDPRYVEGTFPIRRMNFDEAAELAYFGAKILHPSTIQPCKDRGIPVLLKNSMAPDAPGTVISDAEVGGHVYRAVAAKDGITAVRIYSARMLMAYGFLRRVFEVFEKYRTPIDMITTSEVAVSLTVDSDCRLPEIIAELSELGTVEVDTGNSIVCIVGRLDHAEHGRAREIMEAAGDVPLKMISYGASHRSIALLTDTRNRTRPLRNLNDKLFGKDAE